ncbi:MAG: cytochrome P450 [Caulobacteraceae bacterium]
MDARTFDPVAEAPLAGAVPPPGRSRLDRWRARKSQLFPFIPERAYDRPLVLTRSVLGPLAMVNDPAGVKRVLVDNVANYPKTALEQRFFTALFGQGLLGTDGDLWRAHRRVMAPAFDPRSVAGYGPAMAATAKAFLSRWDGLGDKAPVDMAAEMTLLTLRIISRTMFSTDSEDVVDLVGATVRSGVDVGGDFNLLDILPVIGAARMRAREARMASLFAPMDAVVARLVAEREHAGGAAPSDLLGRLVAAKDQETGVSLTAREVRDEVVTIFIAGHETTAVTMDWIWYALAMRPREEARLHEELDTVLPGRTPRQDDLPRLAYTRRLVEEVMRLYPAAPGLSTRVALADDVVCDQTIRKGTAIALTPWVLHRHRVLWDDPERFDPDRFLPERSAGRQRFAYLPFGAGPRVCIGQVLAINEAILILATLAQGYRPRLAPDADVVLQHNVTLRPRHGLKMTLERRTRARR